MGSVQNLAKFSIQSFNVLVSKVNSAIWCWDKNTIGAIRPVVYNVEAVRQARCLALRTIGMLESTLLLLEKDSKLRDDYVCKLNYCQNFLASTQGI